MPELPEVEVVRSGLARWLIGRRIASVDIAEPRSLRRHLPGPDHFAAGLPGMTVTDVVRRGKYLWLLLTADIGGAPAAMLAHLGMSGQILLQPSDAPTERHLRVSVTFDDSDRQLRFVDQRIFGSLQLTDLVPTPDGGPGGLGGTGEPGGGDTSAGTGLPMLPPDVAHIARDPLDPAFDAEAFTRRLRAKHTGIKRALLDQGLISGIGNIYADEALWRARLHYARPTERLTRPVIRTLLEAVSSVMRDALAAGGTSFDALYVNVNGESGYFDRSLDVYGRAGEPCRRCGHPIVRERFMNRSSHFCPVCQRKR